MNVVAASLTGLALCAAGLCPAVLIHASRERAGAILLIALLALAALGSFVS